MPPRSNAGKATAPRRSAGGAGSKTVIRTATELAEITSYLRDKTAIPPRLQGRGARSKRAKFVEKCSLFSLKRVDGEERLFIERADGRILPMVLAYDEASVQSIVMTAHEAVGHGDRDKTHAEVYCDSQLVLHWHIKVHMGAWSARSLHD